MYICTHSTYIRMYLEDHTNLYFSAKERKVHTVRMYVHTYIRTYVLSVQVDIVYIVHELGTE